MKRQSKREREKERNNEKKRKRENRRKEGETKQERQKGKGNEGERDRGIAKGDEWREKREKMVDKIPPLLFVGGYTVLLHLRNSRRMRVR